MSRIDEIAAKYKDDIMDVPSDAEYYLKVALQEFASGEAVALMSKLPRSHYSVCPLCELPTETPLYAAPRAEPTNAASTDDAVALGIPVPEYSECAICKMTKHRSEMMTIQPICRECY